MSQKVSRHSAAPLTPRELSAFCAQLAMLIKSGVPTAESISILLEDTQNPPTKMLLELIHTQLEQRKPLCDALLATGVFPHYFISMTEIGEKSGRLDEVLDALSDYYEREESVSQSIRSAVTYPLVMIVMMALVIGVLVIKVLPVFNDVFIQLGGEMSRFTRSVTALGTGVGRVAVVAVSVVVVVLFVFLILRAFPSGQILLSRASTAFPLTRRLSAQIAAGRFASAMSMMLASGLDADESLDMAERLIENESMRRRVKECHNLIAMGSTFAEAVSKTDLFSGVYARMVSIGFQTGAADRVMKKISQRYDEDVDRRISGILSVLEPTLVVILAVVVGMILLSVMLPLMGVMRSIG